MTLTDIFSGLPSRYDRNGGQWKGTVQFFFTDALGVEEPWFVRIAEDGCEVGQAVADAPAATVRAPTELWIGMVEGTIGPAEVLAADAITVEGDEREFEGLQRTRLFRRPDRPVSATNRPG